MYIEAMTHVDVDSLVWDTEGYYTFGNDYWKDITITADIIYKDGSIGIIPRYDSEISYVLCRISNQTKNGADGNPEATVCHASIDAFIGTETIHLDKKELTIPLVVSQQYQIKSVITRTNYKIYLDAILIFNLEYNGLNNGMGGVYATPTNTCLAIEVVGDQPSEWISNVATMPGAIADLKAEANGDKSMYLYNPSTNQLIISQDIPLIAGSYMLSYNLKGDIGIELYDSTNDLTTSFSASSVDWTRIEHAYTAISGITDVQVRFILDNVGEALINDVQLEAGSFTTTYIHNEEILNTRERSFVTYPSKNNIVESLGGISMWIKPSAINVPAVLFEYGTSDLISVFYTGTEIKFVYGASNLTYKTTLVKDRWYHIGATWRSDTLKLYVDGVKTESNGLYEFSGRSDIIRIGHSFSGLDKDIFNGVIDDVIIFSKDFDHEYVAATIASEDPMPTDDQMILRATFDHAIGNFNKSIIEMSPAPQYGSPVIVEKEDGTIMRKVSFFDRTTGEYKTNNEEAIIYDGVSDYIKVGYSDLDVKNFKITIQDYIGAIHGDPYTVHKDENRIYLTLSNEQKASLKGKPLWVSYQPENSYTIDFNINQPDSFRTTIGKYDGQPLTVTYEGNKFANEKLGTMIELNPLLNSNHQGFLYITKNTEVVSAFRVKASPSDLPADGVAEAIVVIEPLDSNGNFISNAKLEVVTDISDSSIIPNYDPGSILVRERAGRYLYRYRVPLMYFADHEVKQVTDYINIRDKTSEIGVQIPITLSLANEYYNSDAALTLEESNWELIASRLLDVIMDYFKMNVTSLPEGLGDILDFNSDGIIDLQEIVWLNDYKYTQTLYTKYVEYLGWQVLNQ